jgi:hypothetical protein
VVSLDNACSSIQVRICFWSVLVLLFSHSLLDNLGVVVHASALLQIETLRPSRASPNVLLTIVPITRICFEISIDSYWFLFLVHRSPVCDITKPHQLTRMLATRLDAKPTHHLMHYSVYLATTQGRL